MNFSKQSYPQNRQLKQVRYIDDTLDHVILDAEKKLAVKEAAAENYCLSHCILSMGEDMIECDNELCSHEWFHYS